MDGSIAGETGLMRTLRRCSFARSKGRRPPPERLPVRRPGALVRPALSFELIRVLHDKLRNRTVSAPTPGQALARLRVYSSKVRQRPSPSGGFWIFQRFSLRHDMPKARRRRSIGLLAVAFKLRQHPRHLLGTQQHRLACLTGNEILLTQRFDLAGQPQRLVQRRTERDLPVITQ